MRVKGHGTIKKSKAYGTIGTLLLSGVVLATLSVGTTSVDADEVVEANQIEQVTTDASQQPDPMVTDDDNSTFAETSNIPSEEEVSNTQSSNELEVTETEEHQNLVEEPNQSDEQDGANTENVDKNDTIETDIPLDTPKEGDADGEYSQEGKEDSSQEEESINENVNQKIEDSSHQEQVDAVEASDTDSSGATGSATQEVTSVTLGSNGFQIQYNGPVSAGTQIMFAVWSQVNGQDDLIWYTADSNGKVVAKYTGSYGTYYVHTYQNVNGKMIGLNGTSIDIPKPSVTVSVHQQTETTYQVSVDNVPAYITSIVLPTWTEANGQDDIIWYQTTKNGVTSYTATISVAKHSLESGKYNVHVYGTSAVTNTLIGLAGTTFTNDYQFGDVTVNATLGQNGIVLTMPSDVAQGLTVQHAVWSTKNDQDDLIWYRANASGQTVANYTGDYGTYLIHTYAVINGQMVCISATSIEVPKPNVTVTVEKVSDTSAKVTVTNVPIYVTSISLPVWTEANGQDDIRWYQAIKQADGSYTYTFYAKDHGFKSGHYNVHVYGHSNVTKSLVGLSGSNGIDLSFDEILTKPTVTVQNHNSAQGTLQVVISETETSKNIGSVQVAAWSDAEQKNIYWYGSSQVVNGQVVITVDEKYHHNIVGNYTVHVYVKTTDGDIIGYDLGTYQFDNQEVTANIVMTYKGTGVYDVSVSGVYSNGAVKYAVWSDVGGQDDIRWYDASTMGTMASSLFNASQHHGTGTYHIHVYQLDNGQMFFLTSTDFNVKQTNYDAPYFNQRDPRWGSVTYGGYTMASTGCAPTALAMVFSALTGSTVLPTDVAGYLYHNTVEFNRGGEGTTGRGVIMATNQWQFSATVLSAHSLLEDTLREGHYVVAAVQQNKFSPWGWGTSHEIVLKGYSNGMTYVMDPYNSANNGWYPISALWNEQSTQYGDIAGLGSPFVKVTDI